MMLSQLQGHYSPHMHGPFPCTFVFLTNQDSTKPPKPPVSFLLPMHKHAASENHAMLPCKPVCTSGLFPTLHPHTFSLGLFTAPSSPDNVPSPQTSLLLTCKRRHSVGYLQRLILFRQPTPQPVTLHQSTPQTTSLHAATSCVRSMLSIPAVLRGTTKVFCPRL